MSRIKIAYCDLPDPTDCEVKERSHRFRHQQETARQSLPWLRFPNILRRRVNRPVTRMLQYLSVLCRRTRRVHRPPSLLAASSQSGRMPRLNLKAKNNNLKNTRKAQTHQHKIAWVVNFTRSLHEAIQFPEFLDCVHRPDIFHTVVVVLSFENGFSFWYPESVGMLEWIVITHY